MARPLALLALVTVPLALAIAAACGGSGEDAPDSGGDGSGGDAPSGLQLVIYRDTINSKLVALSVADGRRWERPVDPQDFINSIDCTRDGERAAYLVKNLQTGSDVRVSGGGTPVRIEGEGFGLAWAPDASQIVVTAYTPASSENRLDFIDPATGQISPGPKASGPIGAPRWSPDGTKIAFDASNFASNVLNVYTIGDTAARVVAERPAPAFAPDWSPDGSELLFSTPSNSNISQLFSIRPDGTNSRAVTTSEVSKGFPRWSPDGTLVAFAGTILVPVAASRPMVLHNLAVYTMQPDGTGEQPLTDVLLDAWLLGWCVSGPWLNDGWQEAAQE